MSGSDLLKTTQIRIQGGIRGGLVLGRSHKEGGIKMWDQDLGPLYPKTNNWLQRLLQQQCEMQGGEYVINPFATHKFMKRIEEINSSVRDNYLTESLVITTARYVIDCRNHPHILFHIAGSGQYIINRQATIDNLEELERINDYGQNDIRNG